MMLTDRLLWQPFFLTQWQNSCSYPFLTLLLTPFCLQFTALSENLPCTDWRFPTPQTCAWGSLPHERIVVHTNRFDLKLLFKLQTNSRTVPPIIVLVWHTFFESSRAQRTTYITHRLEFREKNYRVLPVSKTCLTNQWEALLQKLSK